MRVIGSIIKYFIYLCIVLIAVSAALFWFDTGSWLVRPLAQRAGSYFLAPMTLNIDSINGSVRHGYTLEGLTLKSGDKTLFTLDYASVSPDWDLVLSGMDGLPFIKALDVHGVSSDLDNVMTIANHFASPEDTSPEDEDTSDSESDSPLRINPFSLSVRDVNFGTPYANLSLDGITLNPSGFFALNAEIFSRDKNLPLKADARLNFEPLEILSSDLRIGKKGTGKLVGTLIPVKANLFLTALSLEEFMQFAPDMGIKASGRIDAKLSALTEGEYLTASGVVSMPRAEVMGVPLNFRLPFAWDGVSVFSVNDAALHTKAASLNLTAQTDINNLAVKAKGEALNISLNEIGRMFAPEIGLDGEGGTVKFDVDAVLEGDILGKTTANISANIPSITAAGIQILKGLSGQVKLDPGHAPRISMNGEIFKGKLFARGEAQQDSEGNIKPSAIISVVNLDIPTVIRTFPAAAKSVKKPAGKITARAVISDNLDVNTKITSDKLSANGVTLTNILANLAYSYSRGTANLDDLSLNLGKGKIYASGGANLNTERFSFRADAENIEPRVIPELRDIKGVYNLFAQGSGKYTDIKTIKAEAELTAKNVAYAEYPVGSVNVPVDFANNVLRITNGVVSLPKGSVALSGNVNLNTNMFNFSAEAENVEPRYIKALKDLAGTYSLNASASGNFTNINTIKANADLKARNVGYAGMNIGNVDLPVKFANSLLNIPGAKATLPGGSMSLKGSVNLKNTANPFLDVTASTQGINLAEVMNRFDLQNQQMPVSGKVWGSVSVKGPLSKAGVSATLRAVDVKAGESVDIPSAALDVAGNTQVITVRNLEGTFNGATFKGNGNMKINQKNIMNSNMNVQAKFGRLNLKKLLTQFTGSAPVTGVIRGDIALRGTPAKPALDVKLNAPVIQGSTEIHDIAVKLRAPAENHYIVNAKARINEFKPEADIDLKNDGGIWSYAVNTKPLDIDKAVQTQKPEMAGMAKGLLTVSVNGNTKPNSNINVKAAVPNLKLLDKVDVKNISLPVVYRPSVNKVELKNASARLSDGDIKTGFEYDMNKSSWKGNVKIAHLDFGTLVSKFLPEGELVGSIDAEIKMNGRQGVMSTSYADGKFTTGPGYFHKMKMLDSITPTKRVSFEKINGSFFWNGSDVFLNPGTGARAGYDEPLYRYVTVNGSLGIPGKGLKLLCDGRFDLKILDQFLGAMKGVFQYMTGSLARDVLRDAAGRVLGIKRKDFQNVSFTLANSWENLSLENLKITKPIEDFLPIDILNRDKEEQKDDTQFKLQLKIPTGKGYKSAEEDSAGDQLKEQIIDNLFNYGL